MTSRVQSLLGRALLPGVYYRPFFLCSSQVFTVTFSFFLTQYCISWHPKVICRAASSRMSAARPNERSSRLFTITIDLFLKERNTLCTGGCGHSRPREEVARVRGQTLRNRAAFSVSLSLTHTHSHRQTHTKDLSLQRSLAGNGLSLSLSHTHSLSLCVGRRRHGRPREEVARVRG